ncbi:MAG: YvcK family protein, partial [Oscillospiraceae bacterium]|nr:YvcK family protein [Oscillospiraceae bacterium]
MGISRYTPPSIAVIGGGTGLSTMLRGLKRKTSRITAIVTVTDDGGGSGVLRRELGMPPPGDIRSCILTLANAEPAMEDMMSYRFREGSLAGQSLGNLVLAALNDMYPAFDQAVAAMGQVLAITGQVLAITGQVLPVTNENLVLQAEFTDGAVIRGETRITDYKRGTEAVIRRVS